MLDVHPPPGGEVVDDHDVVVLCQMRCSAGTEQEHRQGATVSARLEPMKPAPPVTVERMKRVWRWGGLGLSEWSWASCLPEAGMVPKNRIGVSFKVASEHSLVR